MDLTRALEGLYTGEFLNPAMRDYLLGLMAVRTEKIVFVPLASHEMLPDFSHTRPNRTANRGDMGILEYQGETWQCFRPTGMNWSAAISRVGKQRHHGRRWFLGALR